MFRESFQITGIAVAQIFLLGAIGYFLVKKHILSDDGLDSLSFLTMNITLPALIFCQLLKDFSFKSYPNWWLYPILSIVITCAGLALGWLFSFFIKGLQHKLQFLSLVGFQNSGYLPLALFAALLPKEQVGSIFIYLFLFLLGFNLVMFSVGSYLLSFDREKKFSWTSLFSPPVITVILSLALIYLGLNKFIPNALIKPLRQVGDCTLPLAMFVIGGGLAQISLVRVDKRANFLMILAKLVILPLLGLGLVLKLKLPQLLGLLIVMELAVPPATSLSIIIRSYKKEDLLISQGIFLGHIASIVTIPLFLSLYFALVMIQ
jgi:hypothetical protein